MWDCELTTRTKMWAEATRHISAAAEVSDPSFAEFQRFNFGPAEAAGKPRPSGVPSSSCVPSYRLASSPSSRPPSSSCSNVTPSSTQREKIRHARRNSNTKNPPMQAHSSAPGTAQHHVESYSRNTAETETPAHSCSWSGLTLDMPRDGTHRPEDELKELLLQKEHVAGNLEHQAPAHGTQAFSFPRASGADSEDGVVIFPSPECVLKCKLESGEKVFINLCSHDGIDRWHYKDILLEEEGHGTSSEGLRIPLSVGERTECHDKAGDPALAVDVVFNKGTLGDCLKQLQLKQLLAQFAMAAVSHKYNLKLQESFSFPRLTYKNRGSNPRPQRIKTVKRLEMNQITSLSSTNAAGDTPNQSAPLPCCASKSVSSSGQYLPMPTFECWFVRPFALRDFVSFLRDKLGQVLRTTSALHVEPCAADSSTKALLSDGSAGPSKRELVVTPNLTNTQDWRKGQNEPSAPGCMPFVSVWVATARTEGAGSFEDIDCVEKRGAINAFDFDRITHEESEVCNDTGARGVSPPTAGKIKGVSHQETKGADEPSLLMKRAFLLSPEERRRQKEVAINKSLLKGTIFVFQLDVRSLRENASESTLPQFSHSTVGGHRQGSHDPHAAQSNVSAAVFPALLPTGNSPLTPLVAPLRDRAESSTTLAFPADTEANSTSFTTCSTKGSDRTCAAEHSFSTTATTSFPAPNSGCGMNEKMSTNLCAATSFPSVEISDMQLLVTFPDNRRLPLADGACRSSCGVDYPSSSFPSFSSSSTKPAGPLGSRSSVTTEPRKFLYVFPFAFRSNFAFAYLFPKELLTVLVPTDLTAAAVLEENLVAFMRPTLYKEVGEVEAGVSDSIQLSTYLALSRHGSNTSPQHGLIHSTIPQTEIRADASSKKDTIAPRADQAAVSQASIQGLPKGFANETLDAVF